MKPNDQPAFPGPYVNDKGGLESIWKQEGMTLRDYFAAKAMQGAIAHGLFNADKCKQNYAEYVAAISYVYADEMLKAREE